MTLCFLVVGVIVGAKSSKKRKHTDTRVYLEHADELQYDIYGKHPDAQFVKGKVSFLHNGARLTCDSALYFQQTNSFQAFGHVKMKQGDTLTLTSEYAYYDGNQEMAEARRNVVLTHRKTKLYCDSLNYDRLYSTGYFFEGGKLVDGSTTLTSDWGQYNTEDREAIFYYNVKLRDNQSTTESDTLYYDTRTRRAHIVGASTIKTKDDIIHTKDGYYNSSSDYTELYSRSTIERKDGKTITGDTLFHNAKSGVNEAFGNVFFDDPNNKNGFTGDYGYYNEQTGAGLAMRNACVIDYSQGDTLYAHGDTIKLFTYNINTDSVYRVVQAAPHVRIFRPDMQAMCDSMVMNSQDSTVVMYKDPIMWNNGRQVLGEEIHALMNDSTIRFAHIIGQAFSIEMHPDSTHFDQVSSKEMKAWFDEKGELKVNQAEGNVLIVYYPIDEADSSLIGLNYTETDTMRMYFAAKRKLEKIWMCKHQGTMYPISQIPPAKLKLPGFAWFDELRPKDKDDIFVWKPKKGGSELKPQTRHKAPLQTLKTQSEPTTTEPTTTEPTTTNQQTTEQTTEQTNDTK